jgi:hypothetical protein
MEWRCHCDLARRAFYYVGRKRGSRALLSLVCHSDALGFQSQLWVCGDGTVTKFKGDVEAYKVCWDHMLRNTHANYSKHLQSLIVSNIKAKP